MSSEPLQIFTAGYGNLGFETFIDRLRSLEITHLVDVRAVPWSSYHVQFRREELQVLMPSTGIRYIFMGDTLGGMKGSSALCKKPGEVLGSEEDDRIAPEDLRSRPELKLGVRKLLEAARDPGRTICLMCGCLRAETCHRSWLLGEVLSEEGVLVVHVGANAELLSQATIMALRTPEQSTLF